MRRVDYYFKEGETIPEYCFGETDTGRHFFLENTDTDEQFGFFGIDNTHKIDFNQWLKIFPESRSYFMAKKKELATKLTEANHDQGEMVKVSGALLADKTYGDNIRQIKHRISYLDRVIKQLSTATIYKKLDNNVKIDKNLIARVKSVPMSNFITFNSANYATSIWEPSEKTPSLYYYPKENQVHCFSSGNHADVIDVVKIIHNLNFVEAVKFLYKYI